MIPRAAHRRSKGGEGFTLVEALVAMALMGLVLASLATVSSQWLPKWNYGMAQTQRRELLALGLERIGADLAEAEFMPASRNSRQPIFEGTSRSVTFVRGGVGPNAGPGLDIVRIGEEKADDQNYLIVRRQAPFRPLNVVGGDPLNFTDPVVLLKPPYRLSFSYAGVDREWREVWTGQTNLPAAIKLTVRDTTAHNTLSTAISIHADVSVECLESKSFAQCLTVQSQPPSVAGSQSRS